MIYKKEMKKLLEFEHSIYGNSKVTAMTLLRIEKQLDKELKGLIRAIRANSNCMRKLVAKMTEYMSLEKDTKQEDEN